MRLLICIALGLTAIGCDDDGPAPQRDLATNNNPDQAVPGDLSLPVDRGPTDVRLSFEPSALYWDAPSQTLYISTASNQIVRWTDGAGLELFATVPFGLAPHTGDLGGLVRLSDGRIVAAVAGAGVNGGVVVVSADGTTVTAVPGLQQARQRVGLTLAQDGTLYDDWFTGSGTMNPKGGVSKLDLSTGELDVLLGLKKPFGLVVNSAALFIADQPQNEIVQMPLSNMNVDGGTTTVLASLTTPDFLALGPGSDLFASGPEVYRVASDGTVSQFAPEMRKVTGLAYDGDHTRLFVGDPDAKFNADAGISAVLHILPVD